MRQRVLSSRLLASAATLIAVVGAGGRPAMAEPSRPAAAPVMGATPATDGLGGTATAAAVAPGASVYHPVVPSRLADTRLGSGYSRISASMIRITVTGRAEIPRSATAVMLTLTVADAAKEGYLTAFPSASPTPNASNVNFGEGDTIANSAVVQLGANGSINVFSSLAGAKIIVDVVGFFETATAATAAGRYVPIAAQRVLDTRDPGVGRFEPGEARTVRFPVSAIPASATAVVANLTYLDAVQPGFFTAWAEGRRPDASNGNLDSRRQTRAHMAVVPTAVVDGTQTMTIYSSGGAHVLVDIAGYFTGPDDTPGTSGMFVSSAPQRVLDTRSGEPVGAGGFAHVAARSGLAVWANLTSVGGQRAGFVSARPAFGAMPTTSALNTSVPGETIANAAVINLSNQGAQLYSDGGEHLIADVSGTFTGSATPAVCRTVVLAHGGSYTGGSPADLGPWASRFRLAGWTVVNADYPTEPDFQDKVWGWWYPRTSVFQDVPAEMEAAHEQAVTALRPQVSRAAVSGCVTHVLGYSSGGSALADAVSSLDGVTSFHLVASAVLDVDDVGGPPMHVWHSANDPIIRAEAAAESCPRWMATGAACTLHDLGSQDGAHIRVELDAATRWLLNEG